MKQFDSRHVKRLTLPAPDSHKGQNGKLLVIGGSNLFHAASLWALEISSKLVDMVFFASVPQNNEIVLALKKEFRNGIVIPRDELDSYVAEADCILLGPGMQRSDKQLSVKHAPKSLSDINALPDEGEQCYFLTQYLLQKYPDKKWVIDAGALQMLEPDAISKLTGNVILTPHPVEFVRLLDNTKDTAFLARIDGLDLEGKAREFTKIYNCILLVKSTQDIVCSPTTCLIVSGGNAGMTKGGTGDVLSGLVASLFCRNDRFTSAAVGSYINKRAGDKLYEKVAYFYNASDLVKEIPYVLKEYIEESKV